MARPWEVEDICFLIYAREISVRRAMWSQEKLAQALNRGSGQAVYHVWRSLKRVRKGIVDEYMAPQRLSVIKQALEVVNQALTKPEAAFHLERWQYLENQLLGEETENEASTEEVIAADDTQELHPFGDPAQPAAPLPKATTPIFTLEVNMEAVVKLIKTLRGE